MYVPADKSQHYLWRKLKCQEEIKQLYFDKCQPLLYLSERRKHSKIENENSYLKTEVIKRQEKLNDAHNVILNLNCDYSKP